MPCFRPLYGFRSRVVNPTTGKRSITFSERESFPRGDPRFEVLTIPCGQCIWCRLEHSRQWAVRCLHEASLYSRNCFLTLTYNDTFLPPRGFLDYNAPVLFMKRLREQCGSGIRSFGCAEYGDLYKRPHYHLCVFNFDFDDKYLWSMRDEIRLYRSDLLESLWKFGNSIVGDVTFESAAYVARYVTKKVTGKLAASHYEEIDPDTGEVFQRPPERAVCVSRRPGVGRDWYDRFGKYVRDNDFVILRGRKVRPPKYYDRLFDLESPVVYAAVKAKRKVGGERCQAQIELEHKENFDKVDLSKGAPPKHRLYVMEDVMIANSNRLKRGFENE